jgi:predicted MFS family arabinose efflux permease
MDAHGLAAPWFLGVPFMLAGLVVASLVRPDPKTIAATYPAERPDEPTASLLEVVRRPGVPAALLGVVTSFAVMAGVMNLAGYMAVGRGHDEGDVFTMISIHIVGMYGLVLVVGDLIDRVGRRRTLVGGLAVMACSNAALTWFGGMSGMSLALLGLGLGWNLSYVAATTELVSLTAPAERGRLIGFSDFGANLVAAALALLGGIVYSDAGIAALALSAAALAGVPALWLLARPGPRIALSPAD